MAQKKKSTKNAQSFTNVDPQKIANIAGLIYVDDKKPGMMIDPM